MVIFEFYSILRFVYIYTYIYYSIDSCCVIACHSTVFIFIYRGGYYHVLCWFNIVLKPELYTWSNYCSSFHSYRFCYANDNMRSIFLDRQSTIMICVSVPFIMTMSSTDTAFWRRNDFIRIIRRCHCTTSYPHNRNALVYKQCSPIAISIEDVVVSCCEDNWYFKDNKTTSSTPIMFCTFR